MLGLVKRCYFNMSNYKKELEKAMLWLSEKGDTFFMGQSLEYGGIAMAQTFEKIPPHKLLEMPVAENLQLGISTGMAIEGFIPISVYPRWNFLLLAADQLVNHLDKISLMTEGQYKPKVIIRVAVGTEKPVNPQEQHLGDFSEGFKNILKTIEIIRLTDASQILPAYQYAYNRTDGVSTILVESHQF
jgi:pyruvate/2-oxoglutarate/acetoin dehydrogenase E1 component